MPNNNETAIAIALAKLEALNPPPKPVPPKKTVNVSAIVDSVIGIINENPKKTITLCGFGVTVDDLHSSSTCYAEDAREELEYFRNMIYLDALDEYNKRVGDDKEVRYWECSDDATEICDKLYEYILTNFEVVVE